MTFDWLNFDRLTFDWLTDERRVLIGRILAVSAVAAGVVGTALYLAIDPGALYDDWIIHNGIGALALQLLGWPMVRARPRNRAVWLFPWMGLAQGLNVLGSGLHLAAESGGRLAEAGDAGPIDIVVSIMVSAAWVPGVAPLVTLALLWFPDGEPPTPRWRPVGWLSGVAIAGLTLTMAWSGLEFDGIVSPQPVVPTLMNGFFLTMAVASMFSVAAVVAHYRRSRGVDRRRFRWIGWAAGTTAAIWLAANIVDATGGGPGGPGGPVFKAVSMVGLSVFLVGYAVAIWRHQLFDIDIVISRTLLFGFLAVFIGGVYTAVVFGLGAVLTDRAGGSRALALLATVVVAVLFHPVRVRLEHLANRLVYGPRVTPYEVLSDLNRRLNAAEETAGLLDRMVERLAAGTGAERVVLWQWLDPAYTPLAAWDAETGTALADRLDPVRQLPADTRAVLIERGGEQLGAFTVALRPGEELNSIEERLLDDLAGSAGLVLDKARLVDALADRAAALETSRRRLVEAQVEERQHLERRLQAGTQQHLTALRFGLNAAADAAEAAGLDPVAAQLEALVTETDTARDEIRALAQGLYPPVLEAEGLTAAVADLAGSLPVPVEVHSDLVDRFDRDAELAVYFAVAEALTNVVKHAGAQQVEVKLALLDDGAHCHLRFEVADDGAGFAPTNGNGSSTGLRGLDDRLATVGGRVDVDSVPGRGTTVSGSAPARPLATVVAGGT